MNFHINEIVRLKSGGPLMTVAGIFEDRVKCEWFTGAELRRDTFTSDLLANGVDADIDFIEDGKPSPVELEPRFIGEDEDENPTGLETSRPA